MHTRVRTSPGRYLHLRPLPRAPSSGAGSRNTDVLVCKLCVAPRPPCRIDPYGFERPHDYESYKEMMNEYVAVLNRRSLRWSRLLQESPHVEKSLTDLPIFLQVKRYVRKGVPNEHRARIWMAASGAQERLESSPGYYRSLLAAEHRAPLRDAIRADLHRTFPDNILFRSEASLQSSLFNVLVATVTTTRLWATVRGRGPEEKLTRSVVLQGMNFIAGYLIIITKDEEKSFWLMEALLARLLPDYYSPAMLGLKTDVEVLSQLVRMKSPAVGQLMAQYPGIWTLVASRWFICLYVDVLPIEVREQLARGGVSLSQTPSGSCPWQTVLRIWDCLFYEGSKVLFRVALTLVLHHQQEILRARCLPDLCQCFRHITGGAFSLDCHSFMQGMNFIAGYLIIITKDEEKSFWLMEALLARLLPDYYSPAMLGLKTDVEVLSQLVRMKSPAVGQLMAQYPGIWTLVASRWFICLYVDVLPIETVLRIWDCLFYEGSKVLFRVALTLVLHHQQEILRARCLPDLCQCFRHITGGAFSLDCHSFMQ
ncbi:unnamed protein product, partial [Tetraodon nigroviridis]